MTDLTASQWRTIEKESIYLPSQGALGRFIGLGTLRTILRRRRTNDQNALLWALYSDALKLGGEALGGWTTDDLHEYALGSYFGWDRYDALGMKRVKPKKRSSRLTKQEFSDFVEAFVRQMAEHGIVLTLPEDVREAG
jgi:hypothetical protein